MRGAATQVERWDIMRAHDIADYAVKNPQGDELGKIKDVVIDIHRGCIAYAVLASGGFLGLGEKHLAIPWDAFSYNAVDNTFILDIPKERLENAPGFDEKNWPATADREWMTGMYTHFGYEPYWERGTRR
ncbi:MAG TPA: PRC-barrel domain containing protein [Methanoculleus sp.]|nr:PRC-barrel domain containing protein [Methanoculleus sp.]